MSCRGALAKTCSRGDPTIRIRKLGVVPEIEELPSYREIRFSVNRKARMHAYIPVIESRPTHAIEFAVIASTPRSLGSRSFEGQGSTRASRVDWVFCEVDVARTLLFSLPCNLARNLIMAVRANVFIREGVASIAVNFRSNLTLRPRSIIGCRQGKGDTLLHHYGCIEIPSPESGVHNRFWS